MAIVYTNTHMENYIFFEETGYFKVSWRKWWKGWVFFFFFRENRRIRFFYVYDAFHRCDRLVLTTDVNMLV